jgi:hypothetical protein
MTKIKNTEAYPIKKYPIATDYFIGSDSEKNGETVNFPIQSVVNMASGLMDYIFSLSSLPLVSPQGDGYFLTNGITDFSLINTMSISKITLAGQDLTPYLNFLKINTPEFTLKIISKTNQNIFAYYSMNLITEHPDFFVFSLVLAPGNNYLGELIDKDIYTFIYEKIPGVGPDLITQTITDGDTTHAPSGNAVFDALALKVSNIIAGTNITVNNVDPLNPVISAILGTSAGVFDRVYFTGQVAAIATPVGPNYDTLRNGKGSVASVSIVSPSLAASSKVFFARDMIGPAQIISGTLPIGNYSSFLSVLPSSATALKRFTIEIFLCDNAGVIIPQSGPPSTDPDVFYAGKNTVAILDSGDLTLPASNSSVGLSGYLSNVLNVAVGQRFRYHISVARGATGGAQTMTINIGNTWNSYVEAPVPITTSTVTNLSTVPGATATDALNALNSGKVSGTGLGVSGQVTFFTGANSLAGDNGLFWDNANKKLGIGVSTIDAIVKHLKVGDGIPSSDNSIIAFTKTYNIVTPVAPTTIGNYGVNAEFTGIAQSNVDGRAVVTKYVSFIDPNGFNLTNSGGSAIGMEGVARLKSTAGGFVEVITGGYFRVLNDNDILGTGKVGIMAGLVIPTHGGFSTNPANWSTGVTINEQNWLSRATNAVNLIIGSPNLGAYIPPEITSNYSIYNLSDSPNYFKYRLGLNVKNPTEMLEILGNAKATSFIKTGALATDLLAGTGVTFSTNLIHQLRSSYGAGGQSIDALTVSGNYLLAGASTGVKPSFTVRNFIVFKSQEPAASFITQVAYADTSGRSAVRSSADIGVTWSDWLESPTGTGTINTVVKWTSPTVQGNSNITDTGTIITLNSDTRINGNVGLQTSPAVNMRMQIGGLVSGGTTSYVFLTQPTIQADVTATAYLHRSVGITAVAAFTLTNLVYNHAGQGNFGSGSAVTNQSGYIAENTLIGAVNNYGFVGNIPAGTNRWNTYMGGTAQNYFNGNTGFGITTPIGKVNIAVGSVKTSDTPGQADGSVSFCNVSNVGQTIPSIVGKTLNGIGLYLLGAAPEINSNADLELNIRRGDTGTDFTDLTSVGFAFSRNAVSLIRILRNGNTGIGVLPTTTATDKLQVAGNITANAATLANHVIIKSQLDAYVPSGVILTTTNQFGITGDKAIVNTSATPGRWRAITDASATYEGLVSISQSSTYAGFLASSADNSTAIEVRSTGNNATGLLIQPTQNNPTAGKMLVLSNKKAVNLAVDIATPLTVLRDTVTVASISDLGVVKAASFALNALNTAPASATAAGVLGEIRYDANFMYVCTATNVWKRSPLSTW